VMDLRHPDHLLQVGKFLPDGAKSPRVDNQQLNFRIYSNYIVL
jgi:hypothetical protein